MSHAINLARGRRLKIKRRTRRELRRAYRGSDWAPINTLLLTDLLRIANERRT